MTWYHEENADFSEIKGKIAVIGYGSQGMAQAKCLKASGLDVIVGLRKGKSFDKAVADGFKVFSIAEATERAEFVHILLPDECQGEVYRKEIKKNLSKGKTLSFSHGFSITFKRILPPKNVDVIMFAPMAPGHVLEEKFRQGSGVPGLIAVHQDFSGKARQKALGFAKAIGLTRVGVLETTFKEETFTDLFGEQTVLCGGVSELMKSAFNVLVDNGYSPELAYLSVLQEIKPEIELILKHGVEGMYSRISNTAEFGSRLTGSKIGSTVKKALNEALNRIESNEFANQWLKEYKKGCKSLQIAREKEKNSLFEKTGRRVRKILRLE